MKNSQGAVKGRKKMFHIMLQVASLVILIELRDKTNGINIL